MTTGVWRRPFGWSGSFACGPACAAMRCSFGSGRSSTRVERATAGWKSTFTTGWAWPWEMVRRLSAKRSIGSRPALRQGLETLQRIGDVGHQVSVAADLALVLLEMDGREREVLTLADAHVPLMIEDDVDAVVRWDAARARAMARLGDGAEGERLARRSVERAWATDYSDLRGLTQVALAEVLQGSGRTEEAAEALRKAVAVHEAKGNVVSAAITRQKLEDIEALAPRAGPTPS